MLLPSALPFEPPTTFTKSVRPKLVSITQYQSTETARSALQSSCQALQAVLSSTTTAPAQPQQLAAHVVLRSPFQLRLSNSRVMKSSPLNQQAQPVALKGSRDKFEVDDRAPSVQAETDILLQPLSTPKRQRRIPVIVPLGLSAEDFETLDRPRDEHIELDMPDLTHEDSSDDDWTTDDDRLLIETMQEKLPLSRREWNDCARTLGKDKQTLGRRWKVLVGDGEVGLRPERRIEEDGSRHGLLVDFSGTYLLQSSNALRT